MDTDSVDPGTPYGRSANTEKTEVTLPAEPALGPTRGETTTLVAEIKVDVTRLALETGYADEKVTEFVQQLVERSAQGYPDLIRVTWKPGYRSFVRTVAGLLMEGEPNDSLDPPEPFVNTFDDAVETLDRLISDARATLAT